MIELNREKKISILSFIGTPNKYLFNKLALLTFNCIWIFCGTVIVTPECYKLKIPESLVEQIITLRKQKRRYKGQLILNSTNSKNI